MASNPDDRIHVRMRAASSKRDTNAVRIAGRADRAGFGRDRADIDDADM